MSRPRVWWGAQGAAAAAVVLVMLGWRWVLLRDSFFNQDDFYLTGRAYRADLDWDFLFRATAGHINPAQQLTFWIFARAAPYDWPAVAAFVLLLQLLATLLMWHVLTRLLPGRWARVVLLAVVAWSPLTLATTLWWSAAIALWPQVICSLLAVLFLLRAHQRAGRRWLDLGVCVLAQVMGLAWHERAILIAPTLFGVAVVLMDDVRGHRRLLTALRRFWPLWAALAVIDVAFLVAHQVATSVTGGGASPATSLQIAVSFVGENVVPGLVSGPWAAGLKGGAVEPRAWVVVVSVVLVLLAGAFLVRRGGPSAPWALGFLVLYVVADLVLMLAGRGGFGRIIGLDPRYSSDVVHAAVIAAALALRSARPAPAGAVAPLPTLAGRRTAPVAVVVLLYLLGSAFGTAVLVPHFQNTADRTYVTNFRGDLAADPNRVVYDALAPAEVVLPLVGADSLLSRIFSPLPESPVFDQPSARLRLVDADGHLRPVTLAGSIAARPGRVAGCGYAVKERPATVRMLVAVSGRLIVHVSYFTDHEATVTMRTEGWRSDFLAQPGPNEMWVPLPDLHHPVQAFTMAADTRGAVCIVGLEAGQPELP